MNAGEPLRLWTPVLTHQFDPIGVLTHTTVYEPAIRQQYFRFVEME